MFWEEKKMNWLQQNVWDEKESVVGLLTPMSTDSASVRNQRMNKKMFFWIKIKAERSSVFVLLVSALRLTAAEKQNPALTSCGPVRRRKNRKLFFSSSLILKIILELFHRLWDLISLAALPGNEGRLRSCFLFYDFLSFFLFSRGTKEASRPLRGASEQTRSHRPVRFACFRLHWLH